MFDHEKAKEFLRLLHGCLKRANIEYFLMQGTALGAWRDKGFTPFEKDIDLGVIEQLGQFPSLAKELLTQGVEIHTRYRHLSRGECHTIVCDWKGVHADIVSWGYCGNILVARAPTDVSPWYCIEHEVATIYNRDWKAPSPYSTVSLFRHEYNIPFQIEKYLELEYGPDWRTPKDDHVSRQRVYSKELF